MPRARWCGPHGCVRSGVGVAESARVPPRPIPNRVVPPGSAGEYCAGNRVGGEAVALTPDLRHPTTPHTTCQAPLHPHTCPPPRGGAVAARWAHNPKVAGSNPAPATTSRRPIRSAASSSVPQKAIRTSAAGLFVPSFEASRDPYAALPVGTCSRNHARTRTAVGSVRRHHEGGAEDRLGWHHY